ITGIEGMGSASTSSPISPVTASPCSFTALTSAPRAAQDNSPVLTGNQGEPSKNAVHKSVPPDTECTATPAFTCSLTYSKPSGGKGAPVEPIAASSGKQKSDLGDKPWSRHAMRKGALTPNRLTFSSSANRH